jgi:hypothetical protein
MKNDTKVILRSALLTLIVIIVLFVVGYFVMLFCFTESLADFFYSLGCENLSASLYHRVYEKTDDINFIYKSLSIEIKQNDNGNIIKYYEQFSNDDEYHEFINKLEKYNEELNLNLLEKSLCLDELNTINGSYVKALWCIDEKEKAINFAMSEFENMGELSLTNVGGYSLGVIVENLENKVLNENNITSSLQIYFDNLAELFESVTPANNLEKSYLIRLGNRCMSAGIDVNNLYEDNTEKITENQTVMNNINSKIMELVR